MTSDDATTIRDHIPAYVNGTLPESERSDFEARLARDEALQREVASFSEIHAAYQEEHRQQPAPSEAVFQRVRQRIAHAEAEPRLPPAPSWRKRIQSVVGRLWANRQVAWGLALAQAAVILLLLAMPSQQRLVTLSGSDPSIEKGLRINLVFQASATEQQIRTLLNAHSAVIVYGPTEEGLYIVACPVTDTVEELLNDLRSQPIVLLAERHH